ncbi:MAG: ribosomal-protein-alanine N-acetyltransferase, partial [Gammaproteobacteria bacterium]|nr:ribosomal-protein-alanine N-acetyltransferase [Gammaproteobacteria bacterium]
MIANPSVLAPLVREMRHGDVSRIAAIERQAYEFPWSAGIFRDCLLAGYTTLVVEHRGEIVAYAIMSVAAGEA